MSISQRSIYTVSCDLCPAQVVGSGPSSTPDGWFVFVGSGDRECHICETCQKRTLVEIIPALTKISNFTGARLAKKKR